MGKKKLVEMNRQELLDTVAGLKERIELIKKRIKRAEKLLLEKKEG